jgi:hypothetical protein
MLKRNLFLASIFAISIMGCGKTSDGKTDCQNGNYGILEVNYGDTSRSHSIQVSTTGVAGTTKLTPAGKSSDTMHVFAGNYVVIIRSHSSLGGPILNSKTISTTINQCIVSVESSVF